MSIPLPPPQVRHRIATGLSREGWAITRNLCTLLVMNAMGILFFNYTLKVGGRGVCVRGEECVCVCV